MKSRGIGALIQHEVLPRSFAQAYLFSLCQFMGRGHDEHERLAMHRDYLESRILTDRQAQKTDIERSCLQHLYLIYGENIAKGEFYFGIQFSKLTNDGGYYLVASS